MVGLAGTGRMFSLIRQGFRLKARDGETTRSSAINIMRSKGIFVGNEGTSRPSSSGVAFEERQLKSSTDKAEAVKANWKARCDLAACYRILSNLGLSEGVCNHLSVSCPSKDASEKLMLLVDYGLHWSEVTASSLLGLSLKDPKNPTVVEGNGQAEASATCIHNGIHHSRPNINCVLHLHTPYATALSCLKDPTLKMIHQNSTRFYNDVCYDMGYDGVATGSVVNDEGVRLGKIIGNYNIMFMQNHGVLVIGNSVEEAFDQIYYLERAAMYQILAMSTGKEISEIPEDVVKRNNAEFRGYVDFYAPIHFNAMRRLLEKEEPYYAS